MLFFFKSQHQEIKFQLCRMLIYVLHFIPAILRTCLSVCITFSFKILPFKWKLSFRMIESFICDIEDAKILPIFSPTYRYHNIGIFLCYVPRNFIPMKHFRALFNVLQEIFYGITKFFTRLFFVRIISNRTNWYSFRILAFLDLFVSIADHPYLRNILVW